MSSGSNQHFFKKEFMWVNFAVEVNSNFDEIFFPQENRQVFHFIAASSLVHLKVDFDFAKTLNKGNAICDSRVIEILSSVLGFRIQRIRGADFVRIFFSKIPRPRRHFFFGSTPEVMESLIGKIEVMSIVAQEIDYVCPKFEVQLENLAEELIKEVTNRDLDYVWIAMGSPKQDYLANALRAHFEGSIFCVGAAVDFVSGCKSEAPALFQFLGIEWIYRFAQEPRRLFVRYTFGNAQFISLFCNWVLRARFLKSRDAEGQNGNP